MRTLLVTLTTCLLVSPAIAKYSGGTGEPNDPYQIATAADLTALGETPEDYDKHFILTADINLDPNLPGGKVFDRAVIAPDTNDTKYGFDGTPFNGVFDGAGHTLSHLTINGSCYLGLFGRLGSTAVVSGLSLQAIDVGGTSNDVGGVVGVSEGTMTDCHSTGRVTGNSRVGGLVGDNQGRISRCHTNGSVWSSGDGGGLTGGGLTGLNSGYLTACHSTCTISGTSDAGGLVGYNGYSGWISHCCATGATSGFNAGGLVADNGGTVTACYSTGAVSGANAWAGVGGLVGGMHGGCVAHCYSTGTVRGPGQNLGGLAGRRREKGGDVVACFWDIQISGQTGSDGGTGKTTVEMQTANTFLEAGWDFVGQDNALHETWHMQPGHYPVLAILSGWAPRQLPGSGTLDDPYLISNALELGTIIHYRPDAHYRLVASIDLSGIHGVSSVIPSLEGVFDGNGSVISNLTITGGDYVGLFGKLESEAEVRDLGVTDVNVTGSRSVGGLVANNAGTVRRCYSVGVVSGTDPQSCVGGLVGGNNGCVDRCYSDGAVSGNGQGSSVGGLIGWNHRAVTNCHSTGSVTGGFGVGGLVGGNEGRVAGSYSTGEVRGGSNVGGLVGINSSEHLSGSVTQCYATGPVIGGYAVGGLVGSYGSIRLSYSTGSVVGESYVGGLAGILSKASQCYSAGSVVGTDHVGGLVGRGGAEVIKMSFWDTQTSGQSQSDGGMGQTTAEMVDANTFMAAGWDFVGQPDGPHDIWAEPESGGYPILWWQLTPLPALPTFSGGAGEPNDPYLISTPPELNSTGYNPRLMGAHFELINDVNLTDTDFHIIGDDLCPFTGSFAGSGHTVSHLTIATNGFAGLFGQLDAGAEIENLGLVDVNATGATVGGLAAFNNGGSIRRCYSSGSISGSYTIGGLVGENRGNLADCYSTGTVSGSYCVGGLVGSNGDALGILAGVWVGTQGAISRCYSTCLVEGPYSGGLTGFNLGSEEVYVRDSFWDIETSNQVGSAGGTDKTTAEMQNIQTFLDAGWDFVGETANGPNDIWKIAEGLDYPRLWWETTEESN
ncbi:MAG: hypothetical protein KBE65_10445 [Phycisphaerae bacterium]|nr:hypothetical protein [Phycisphaerae bacterium]